jgi:queuosine precursor transporter
MINTIVYVISIVAVNYGFTAVPLIPLPNGIMWPPMSLVVGFIFVVRDFAQREVGHNILFAMFIGGIISWFMATPEVAVASVTAFTISELVDWAVYSFTGYRFSQRILLSSAVSTPIDSAIFLGMIGLFSIPTVAVMTISKMVGALMVFWLVRRREVTELELST